MNSSNATTVTPYSIGQLVDIHCDTKRDKWRLSLVQRDAVWKELQVAYLLDSLLWGYPIGSLLLCTVERGGSVLVRTDGTRRRKEASKDVYQLLDGQQRMNALAALFAGTENENHGYLLSLDMDRDLTDLTKRRKSVKRSLRYIHLPSDDEIEKDRWSWLDTTGLREARPSLRLPNDSSRSAEAIDAWLEIASQIDSACTLETWRNAQEDARKRAADRVRRLVQAWDTRSVPVVRLALRDPTDVLQVFNRVNGTGTPVAGDDVFFAAVRTLWNDAEENIARVSDRASPHPEGQAPRLYPAIDALRLITRVASLRNGGGDVVPLDVERLRAAKEKGKSRANPLVGKMEALSKDESFLSRLERAVSRSASDSGLGYALHEVPKRLLDPVFAWAATHKRDELESEDFAPAWAFLLGATAFRYMSIFGPTFERIALEKALRAASRGATFPLEPILRECRARWPELRKGRRSVDRVTKDETTKRALVRSNAVLFLHIVQGIPFDPPPGRQIDVEHLYPQALMAHMKWRGPHGEQKLQRHPAASSLLSAGNLYVLDRTLNRSVGKKWPDDKLEKEFPGRLWPPDLFLEEDEKEALKSACVHLRDKERELHDRIPAAMEAFTDYVDRRELRIFEQIEREFPLALEFAAKR